MLTSLWFAHSYTKHRPRLLPSGSEATPHENHLYTHCAEYLPGLISWAGVTIVLYTCTFNSCICAHQYIRAPYPPVSTPVSTLASSMYHWLHLWAWPALDVSGSCELASSGVEARKASEWSLVSWWVFSRFCSVNTGVSVDSSLLWVSELGAVLGTSWPPDLRVRVRPSSAASL